MRYEVWGMGYGVMRYEYSIGAPHYHQINNF